MPRTGRYQADVVNTDTCTTDHLETVARGLKHLGRSCRTTDDDRIKRFQCPSEKIVGAMCSSTTSCPAFSSR